MGKRWLAGSFNHAIKAGLWMYEDLCTRMPVSATSITGKETRQVSSNLPKELTMKDKEDDYFGKLILLLTVIGLILFMIKWVNAFIR